MRNGVRKYCAALLVLWYCVSIIGFDVHTCKGDGRSFLATAVSGMNCSDIHPGHDCAEHSHCCCFGDSDSGEGFSSDCCTDDYQVLVLTGICREEPHRHYDECHCGHCPCTGITNTSLDIVSPLAADFIPPGFRFAEPASRSASVRFGVWRI